MSCGFDPFGDHDAALLAHAASCDACGRVLGVLGACGAAWRAEAKGDELRATYRERRLARPSWRRPAKRAAASAVFFVGLGVASAWAFERVHGAWRGPTPTVLEAPPLLPAPAPVVAKRARVPAAEPPQEEPEEAAVPMAAAGATGAPAATAATPPSAEELWKRAQKRLAEGDRPGAAKLFRRVVDARDASAQLRRRATFRWGELLMAMGDTVTPKPALTELVNGPDPTLAAEAAALLEPGDPGLK